MTDILRKNLAPIGDKAWAEIESQAQIVLKAQLSGRKLVDVKGPFGWEYGSVNLGRVQVGKTETVKDVTWGVRLNQPLVEIRTPFSVNLWEMDNLERGARDADFDSLQTALRRAALFEENAIFHGFEDACIRGILPESPHKPVLVGSTAESLVDALEKALIELEKAGVGGPFAAVLNGDLYGLLMSGAQNGYPIRERAERFFAAGVHWSPAAQPGWILSARGGDYELTVGQDFSIGYKSHTEKTADLYLTESFTFRVLEPRAAVALKLKK
ncbi:MAG: family 1 encapsulin nanocompartment shell protein [Kiritimatiellia bacterium]|nr:family 1 encapsulin nanocompartment shell protein [Kiritimatiellia bacterium]